MIICIVIFQGCSFGNARTLGSNVSVYPNPKPVQIDASNISSQRELLETVSPAVVGILAGTNVYDSIGTGVCVMANGYVLTNNHVVEGADYIRLYLFNGNTCDAKILWRNANMDLAVLKSDVDLPYLKMAEDKSYKVGEDVYAIGTPIALQFKHSATKGMISATNRTLQVDTSNGYSTLANLIQHDASINPGNSGGPLINTKGEVIGINTAKITDAEAMGFAIPVELIKPIVSSIKADGKFESASLGVFGYDDSFNGFDVSKTGVYVVDVKINSPAERLGLKKGDVIKSIDGRNVENTLNMRVMLMKKKAGQEITIKYVQNGQEKEGVCYLEKSK